MFGAGTLRDESRQAPRGLRIIVVDSETDAPRLAREICNGASVAAPLAQRAAQAAPWQLSARYRNVVQAEPVPVPFCGETDGAERLVRDDTEETHVAASGVLEDFSQIE